MSNPTSVVTERRLGAFYQEILPYLGGSADAGFTPVGSVIAIMGVTAPANYLACNGQIVNVADYPELANYFEQQFGTKYKFGGSGTTFGIPDLRGEFLRGTGTNSHTNQGSGADVGTHQNSTLMPEVSSIDLNSSNRSVQILADTGHENYMDNVDARTSSGDTTNWLKASASYVNTGRKGAYVTIRPTNTSILWCIATKNIYLNPSMDYSTSEKVVGKWIDGSTLYQRTFIIDGSNIAPNTMTNIITKADYNMGEIVNICGMASQNTTGYRYPLQYSTPTLSVNLWERQGLYIAYLLTSEQTALRMSTLHVTIQYTKTT